MTWVLLDIGCLECVGKPVGDVLGVFATEEEGKAALAERVATMTTPLTEGTSESGKKMWYGGQSDWSIELHELPSP